MNRFYLIAIVAAVFASGCRIAENLDQTQTLTGRDYQIQPSGSIAIGSKNSKVEPVSENHRGVHLLPRLGFPHVQPVSYQQEPVSYEPKPGVSQSLAAEPVLIPQAKNVADLDLSLENLERMALENNPALAQATSRVEATWGNWIQTGLPPNTVVGYSGQQLGSRGQAEQQGVFIGQELITGKKLRLNREVAAWKVERAERELSAYRLRVLTDVRIGYYDVLIAQRRRELASDLVRISKQGEEAAQALFKVGEVSEIDPLRARIESETAQILLQTSNNKHEEAWRQLIAVLGMPELPLQRLDGELKANNLGLSWQQALRQLLSESPEIAAATADAQAARWAIDRAYAEIVPNIDVQAVIQDDQSTGSTNGNIQVSMPIPFWNRNQGGIRKAFAEASAAEQAVDRLALDLQTRLASAFQRYESARNQVDKYSRKDGILDNTQRSLNLVQIGYKAEELGVLDLLSAQRTFFKTNLAYLDSQRELWVSAMEIKGLLLRDSLSK